MPDQAIFFIVNLLTTFGIQLYYYSGMFVCLYYYSWEIYCNSMYSFH